MLPPWADAQHQWKRKPSSDRQKPRAEPDSSNWVKNGKRWRGKELIMNFTAGLKQLQLVLRFIEISIKTYFLLDLKAIGTVRAYHQPCPLAMLPLQSKLFSIIQTHKEAHAHFQQAIKGKTLPENKKTNCGQIAVFAPKRNQNMFPL